MKKHILTILFLSFFTLHASVLDSLFKVSENYKNQDKIEYLLENFYSVFTQNYEDGFLLANKTVEASSQLKDTFLLGRSHLILGMAFYMRGEYESCLTNYLLSIQYFEAINNQKYLGRTYNELSVYYRKQKQFEQAHDCLNKSYELCSNCADTACVETSLNNRAVVLEMQGDYKNAIIHYYKAMQIATSINNKLGLAFIYLDCAYCYKLMNKLDSAEYLVSQSLQEMIALKNNQGVGLNLINLGDIQLQRQNHTEAIKSYNQCISLALKLNYPDLRQQAYFQLAKLYESIGDFKNATEYLEKSFALKDSIISIQKAKSLAEMEVKYQTEKIENDLLLEKQNNIIQQLKIEQKNRFIIAVTALSVVLVLIIFIWYQRKIRIKQAEKDKAIIDERNKGLVAVIEATENERQRIAKDLHDGIGQQMSGIKLIIANVADKNDIQLKKVSELVDQTAAELRTISHQMMPKVLSAFGIEPAIKQTLEESLTDSNIVVEFDCFNIHQRLNNDVELVIYRVFQELLNNCMKHASATKITVQLYKNQNHIILVFEDNGKGFIVDSDAADGIGMTNMKIRLEGVKGTIAFESHLNEGTVATIRIPL